jgi:hypothetical protein
MTSLRTKILILWLFALTMIHTPNLQSEHFWPENMVSVRKKNYNYFTELLEVAVEKPFTVDTAQANTAIAAAKKSGKILTVFQSQSRISFIS